MKNKLLLLLLTTIISIFITGCTKQDPTPAMQGKQFTQTNMWYEKNRINSVNFSRGSLLPVNTPIKILGYSAKMVEFEALDSGTIFQMRKHGKTILSSEEWAKRQFSSNTVNIKQFNKKEQDAILAGQYIPGMTKEAVLISRGYPPKHATPSLKSNTWKYWSNRWITRNVNFSDDKVMNVKGIGANY